MLFTVSLNGRLHMSPTFGRSSPANVSGFDCAHKLSSVRIAPVWMKCVQELEVHCDAGCRWTTRPPLAGSSTTSRIANIRAYLSMFLMSSTIWETKHGGNMPWRAPDNSKDFLQQAVTTPKKHVFDNSPALLFRLFVVGPYRTQYQGYLSVSLQSGRVSSSSQSVGRLSQPVRQGAGLVTFWSVSNSQSVLPLCPVPETH